LASHPDPTEEGSLPLGFTLQNPSQGRGHSKSFRKFYKAVVQAVLLYGCESWVLTDKVWKVLESFHNRAA